VSPAAPGQEIWVRGFRHSANFPRRENWKCASGGKGVHAIPPPPVVGRMGVSPLVPLARLDQPAEFRLTMSITVFLLNPTLRAMSR